MGRISFTLLIVLSSVIGGLLFWQWNVYSEDHSKANAEQIENVTQQFSVKTVKENLLEVSQIFNGLKANKEYRVEVPEVLSDWTCLKEDGNPCDSSDENPHSFLADNHKIKLSFQIDLGKEESTVLLNQWSATLSDATILNTSIEVIDLNKREGSWVAGLPLKSHRELELIDYYYFEGKGDRSSLYWQPTPLVYGKGEPNIDFFSAEKMNPTSYKFEFLEKLPNFSGLSIIMTEHISEMNGIGLMIVNPAINKELLERKMVYNFLLGKAKNMPLEERWLIDVLTSLLMGQESHVSKGNELLAELKKNHSEGELSQLLEQVFMENTITPEKLDELLGSLVGKKTHFFTLNKSEETKLIPLYYSDVRRIFIQDKLHEKLEVVRVEGDRFVPFIDTFTALGYDVKALEDQETILLNRENNSYRFYVSHNIFIYNEENYGLLENPLRLINGKVYIEIGWLRTIFKLGVSETTEEIKLSYPPGQ